MLKGIIDDITIDDVKKAAANIVNENNNNKPHVNSLDFKVSEPYCEIPKGKDVLMFALVQFGDYERYDLRRWYDKGTRPGKGITFTVEEIGTLQNYANKIDVFENYQLEIAQYVSEKVKATIYEQICQFSEYSVKGVLWRKEATIVDFGYGKKLDFRKWSNDYSICGKGIGVSEKEWRIIEGAIMNIK